MLKIGDKAQMASDAIENYGDEYSNMLLTISRIATKYMPAKEFYQKGMPAGYHPGYDSGVNEPLYDFEEIEFSLYRYELK